MSTYGVSDMRNGYATIPVDLVDATDVREGDYVTAGGATWVVRRVTNYVAWIMVTGELIASAYGPKNIGRESSFNLSTLTTTWRDERHTSNPSAIVH